MPSFRYRALTQNGEAVSGSISAPTAAEVVHRIEYLGLVPIDTVVEEAATSPSRRTLSLSRARAEDVTIFTRDLALLLRAGARINDALELLAQDPDIGRLRPTIAKVRAAVVAGESFGEAISRHPALFSSLYVVLVRVGEASGTLDRILEMLGEERARAATLRRRLTDAIRYPAFVLFASCCVLGFFLLVVLPQFAVVLRDFNAKLDPLLLIFLSLSELARSHSEAAGLALVVGASSAALFLRQPRTRSQLIRFAARLPVVRPILTFYRTALFCRNLGVLLSAGVALTTTLRILADMMISTGDTAAWTKTVDRVRQGGKLSEALSEAGALPPMALRMLRLGEETGQLPVLAGRIADFYEAKLQRSLDQTVAIVGPVAIISISIVVGGLIVSVMTALLSVIQIVG